MQKYIFQNPNISKTKRFSILYIKFAWFIFYIFCTVCIIYIICIFYIFGVHCELTASGSATLSFEWDVQRRLGQLRDSLHNVVKSELCKKYAEFFGDAPFAKRGGLGGTVEAEKEVCSGPLDTSEGPSNNIVASIIYKIYNIC